MALNKEYSKSITSMEQVLLQNSTFTMKEKYCHPTYKIRTFKSKGATLLIVWNTLVMNLLYFLLTQTSLQGVHFIALLFTLPIAGWLADVYLGRYKNYNNNTVEHVDHVGWLNASYTELCSCTCSW